MHRGGCQCGAVRIVASEAPVRISVCHCRMCQRATGGLHAPLAEFAPGTLRIEGEPTSWASSNVSERGFCPRCGTPLFLRDLADGTTEVMLGAMADPVALAPTYQYGVESRMPWLAAMTDLPGYETGAGPNDDDDALPVSRQADL